MRTEGNAELVVAASVPPVPAALTTAERRRRDDLVKIVREGEKVFLRVGRALREINEAGLYRETHATFAAFVADEFGFGRAYAYRQIAAAATFDAIAESPMGDKGPESERVLRPLVVLPPAKAVVAWEKAVALAGDGPVTHHHTRAAVEGSRPPYTPPPRDVVVSTVEKALCEILAARDAAGLRRAASALRGVVARIERKARTLEAKSAAAVRLASFYNVTPEEIVKVGELDAAVDTIKATDPEIEKRFVAGGISRAEVLAKALALEEDELEETDLSTPHGLSCARCGGTGPIGGRPVHRPPCVPEAK